MRVKKSSSAGTTRSYYNGQMPVEEDFDTTSTSNDTVTRNFVVGRAIEAIETYVGVCVNPSANIKKLHWMT